ncbi:MAG: hemerythrin domain-containing protein [Polyangiaceae bacterium]
MNAITLLKADHHAVRELFGKIEKAGADARAKKPLVEKLIRELSVHSAIEEQIFYPEVKKNVPNAAATVLFSLEEHSIVKWACSALDSMSPSDPRYDAKIKVLREISVHHFEEEEGFFPRVRDALGAARLNELGTQLEHAKKSAPTRPHPRLGDEPPANVVLGIGASMVDLARDAGRALLRRSTQTARSVSTKAKNVENGAQVKRRRAAPQRRRAHAGA